MIHEVAHDRVLEILSKTGPVNLPAGIDAELERAFNKARQWSAFTLKLSRLRCYTNAYR